MMLCSAFGRRRAEPVLDLGKRWQPDAPDTQKRYLIFDDMVVDKNLFAQERVRAATV